MSEGQEQIVTKIMKVKMSGDETTIEYSQGSNVFKIQTEEQPTVSFCKAIHALHALIVRNLDLDPVKDRVCVTGYESGTNDKNEQWVIVNADLMVRTFTRKISSFKQLIDTNKDESWFDNNDIEDYPNLLSPDELDLFEKAEIEAISFINGERMQKELPFEKESTEEKNGEDFLQGEL